MFFFEFKFEFEFKLSDFIDYPLLLIHRHQWLGMCILYRYIGVVYLKQTIPCEVFETIRMFIVDIILNS